MEDTDAKISDMIDQFINDKPEQAQQSFHDYLKPKLQSTVQVLEPDDKNKEQ